MRAAESKSMLAQDLGDCRDYRILFFIIGPMIIAMTILHRSAGMKGMTQTASAAPTVYPAWKQNHAVPNA